ncbi:MAG: hypothetical protein MUF15_14900 [Acidobacteria bacterium]|jgi:hypothetical protein|nr:hypothetical protein [Acidobacteriota bacterium]
MRLRHKLIICFILPLIFLQGGCGLFREYKIQGTWKIEKDINGVKTTIIAEFSGSRDYGNIQVNEYILGEYAINFDEELAFIIYYFEPGQNTTNRKDTFTGSFDGHDKMYGTVEEARGDIKQTGQWTADRQTASI